MVSRQQRQAAERRAAPGNNGVTRTQMLSPEQTEDLRQLLRPLVTQWQLAQARVQGYLAGAHIVGVQYNIDLDTGTVTLVIPPGAAVVQPPESPSGGKALSGMPT